MDTRLMIDDLHRENLVVYFVLSLIKISPKSFGLEGNLIDAFLSPDRKSVLAKVSSLQLFMHRLVVHSQYQRVYKDDMNYFYVEFSLPSDWDADIKKFCDGKYSEMSERAKQQIHNYSELRYRYKKDAMSSAVTDVRLLALYKDEKFRTILEEFYDIPFSEDMELLSKPDAKSFLDPLSLIPVPVPHY